MTKQLMHHPALLITTERMLKITPNLGGVVLTNHYIEMQMFAFLHFFIKINNLCFRQAKFLLYK